LGGFPDTADLLKLVKKTTNDFENYRESIKTEVLDYLKAINGEKKKKIIS
jgi:hypothetical protein